MFAPDVNDNRTFEITIFCYFVCVCVCVQTGQEHELLECMPLLEWFANNYKTFGATLEIVTDKSQEGSQFVKGFGGIGGETVVNDVQTLQFLCVVVLFLILLLCLFLSSLLSRNLEVQGGLHRHGLPRRGGRIIRFG